MQTIGSNSVKKYILAIIPVLKYPAMTLNANYSNELEIEVGRRADEVLDGSEFLCLCLFQMESNFIQFTSISVYV